MGEPKVPVLGTQWLSWVLNHKKRIKSILEGEAESCEGLADGRGPREVSRMQRDKAISEEDFYACCSSLHLP